MAMPAVRNVMNLDPTKKYVAAPLRRVRLACSGPERGGRTHFACTAPDPTVILSYDPGTTRTATKFAHRQIHVERRLFSVPPEDVEAVFDAVSGGGMKAAAASPAAKEVMRLADAEYEWFKSAVRQVRADRRIRSLVVDTETHLNYIFKLAKFGRGFKVMPDMYGPANAEMAFFLNEFELSPDLNVIWLQQESDEYTPDRKDSSGNVQRGERTGRSKPRGWNQLGYYVDMRTRHTHRGGKLGFEISVADCGFNPLLAGTSIGGGVTFPELMAEVLPDVPPRTWRGATPVEAEEE